MLDRGIAAERIAMLEKLPDALGHALRDQRAGLDKTAFRLIDLRAGMGALEVRSLVLIVEDADAPTPQPLVHAIVVELAAEDGALAEGTIASGDAPGAGYKTGRNSYLQASWLPPDRRRGTACTAMPSS